LEPLEVNNQPYCVLAVPGERSDNRPTRIIQQIFSFKRLRPVFPTMALFFAHNMFNKRRISTIIRLEFSKNENDFEAKFSNTLYNEPACHQKGQSAHKKYPILYYKDYCSEKSLCDGIGLIAKIEGIRKKFADESRVVKLYEWKTHKLHRK